MCFATFLNNLEALKFSNVNSKEFQDASRELHAILQNLESVESLWFWMKKSDVLSDEEILSREEWAPLDPEEVFSFIYSRLRNNSKLQFIESLHSNYRDKGQLSDKQMLHLMRTYWQVFG